jgi:hypothetical protein
MMMNDLKSVEQSHILLGHKQWLAGLRLAVGATFLLLAAAGLWAAGVTAQVDRNTVPVGETVTLSLVFDEVTPSGAPDLGNLPANLQLGGVSQSSSFTILNGTAQSKITFDYSLLATQPGDVTIPAMQIVVGGKPLATQPIRMKIVPAGTPATPEATYSNLAWLRLTVPKTEIYVGESFPVELQLYVQNAQDVQMPQLSAEGFAIGQSAKPQQTKTQVNNAVYNLVTFRMSASAVRTGDLNLSAECNLTLQIPNRSRNPEPFDRFFNRNVSLHPTVLKAETQVLHVMPLPSANVPETFNGIVGSFTMQVTAGPTNLAVGDPITVKASISGNGPIDALRLPEQPGWREFKSYAPNTRSDLSDPLGLSGTKHFEQVVIPQNHEIKALPPLEFSYFDPTRRTYQTLKGPAILLSVAATVAAAPPPSLSSNVIAGNNASAQDDIVHIKAQLGMSPSGTIPLLRQSWFLLLQMVPLLGWLGLLVARKNQENLAKNPKLRRQREVDQRVREGLSQLRQKAEDRDSETFFATLFRLLQEQLGARLDMPSSAITESVVDEKLEGRGVKAETLTELRELFQMCNMARYAPQKSVKELNLIIPRAERVITGLKEMKS